MAEQLFCPKCRKTMSDVNFYTFKDGTKCDLCKSCLTLHVNNFEPDTFLWILEKFDVPYIEAEWNVLRDRAYAKDPHKVTGSSIIGKYLSKMKLKQWKQYTWADTEMLKVKAEEEAKLRGFDNPADFEQQKVEEMREAYERGEITEAQFQTYAEIHTPDPSYNTAEAYAEDDDKLFKYPQGAGFEEVELVDVGADLTEEDKVYLAMKWGRLYRADEWVALEQLYNEFMNSFDIQGAARIDTLKMICKTSLKMNQAIDCGDVDSYQKLSRVYDAMMKSAKFTEAQNKEGKGDFLDSIGEMVAYCEREGGQIPKYEIKVPYDIIDKIIDDLKLYNKTLIYEDKSLAEEIELYLKNKQNAEDMKRDREEARLKGLDQVELEDKDYIEFEEALAGDRQKDMELIEEELAEDVEE
jgi:hypothetical protein